MLSAEEATRNTSRREDLDAERRAEQRAAEAAAEAAAESRSKKQTTAAQHQKDGATARAKAYTISTS